MSTSFSGEWLPDAKLSENFLDLPHRIYKDHPFWIPESRAVVNFMFGEGNNYFQHGKVWLGYNSKSRLAGFIAPHQLIDGKRAAFFGYWESEMSLDSNQELFEQFEAWAIKNQAEVVFGPINFSTYGMYRIRIDDFSSRQFIGEPYNPEYYPELLDRLGYEVSRTYATSTTHDLTASAEDTAGLLDSIRSRIESEFIIKPVTSDYWMQNIERLHKLSLEIFKENFAYTPVSLADFKKVCGESFAAKICKHSAVAAETMDGDIAGMMLSFPDYSPLVNQAADDPVSPDSVNFEEHFDTIPGPRTLLLKTAGVSDRYRGKQLYTYLFYHCIERALPYYDSSLGCLFIQDNLSRKASDRITNQLRHYGLYSKEL